MPRYSDDLRAYAATQRLRDRADLAISRAGPDELNFRPFNDTMSEFYLGTAKLGQIEHVAEPPQVPMVHSFVIVFYRAPDGVFTFTTSDDPIPALRDAIRKRLREPSTR